MDSNKKNTNVAQVVSQHNIKFEKNPFEPAGTNSSLAVASRQANYDLTSLFECPVCFDYVTPPILQCQNGHLGNELLILFDDAIQWALCS